MSDSEKLVKIKHIKRGMRNICVVAEVVKIDPIPIWTTKLAKATIRDDTGTIILNLWRDQVEQCRVGDLIKVRDAYVKLNRGKLELNTWKPIEVLSSRKKEDI